LGHNDHTRRITDPVQPNHSKKVPIRRDASTIVDGVFCQARREAANQVLFYFAANIAGFEVRLPKEMNSQMIVPICILVAVNE
jgi:hypothetical protein